MQSTLCVTFGTCPLKFSILNTPIADLWLDKMAVRNQWRLDDPHRFYNFNDPVQEELVAIQQISHCIDIINAHEPIINRQFRSIQDQDTLNYLHNIFERYHGMLDQQTGEFWQHAPESVRKALANLNIAVHRCESLSSQRPRVVCTWFGQPKTHRLPVDMQSEYGQLGYDFGGVYLNYVEIGKTARDLAHDDDQYIAEQMFKPFDFYSSDFVITFSTLSSQEIEPELQSIDRYFEQHRDFFEARGISSSRDTRMLPLRFKVAQLDHDPADKDVIISMIQKNQIITHVEID